STRAGRQAAPSRSVYGRRRELYRVVERELAPCLTSGVELRSAVHEHRIDGGPPASLPVGDRCTLGFRFRGTEEAPAGRNVARLGVPACDREDSVDDSVSAADAACDFERLACAREPLLRPSLAEHGHRDHPEHVLLPPRL